MPIVVIRYDNYRVDLERKTSHLGFWNIEVRFTGKPRWLVRLGAKQGRLVITFDDRKKRWYAHVNVEVTLEGKLNGLKAGVDLGREVLAAVATEPLSGNGEGAALLYRGAALKSDYFYCERRIARADRTLSDPKSEEMDRGVLHAERRRRIYQLFCNLATHLARALSALNVSTVFVGYPRGIVREKAGKTTGTWSYWKLMTRIATTLENYGIAVFGVPEDGTSRVCARHGCEVRRKPRGLVKCLHNHVIHADVNAALNILARGASLLGCEVEVPERIKVYSFIPTPSGVKPRNNPAPRAG